VRDGRIKILENKKEKTDWHRVVVFAPGLVNIIKNYVKKGSKIYIEGKLQTREYQDKEGVKKYTTEVILTQYNSTLTLLDSKNNDSQSSVGNFENNHQESKKDQFDSDDIKDEIPF
jgi:single-strand DNA-binding protein